MSAPCILLLYNLIVRIISCIISLYMYFNSFEKKKPFEILFMFDISVCYCKNNIIKNYDENSKLCTLKIGS